MSRTASKGRRSAGHAAALPRTDDLFTQPWKQMAGRTGGLIEWLDWYSAGSERSLRRSECEPWLPAPPTQTRGCGNVDLVQPKKTAAVVRLSSGEGSVWGALSSVTPELVALLQRPKRWMGVTSGTQWRPSQRLWPR